MVMMTIVWDRDDVLNDLMRVFLEQWWIPSHPECPLRYDEITENPPHRLLGVSLKEYHQSLDAFRLSKLAAEMAPNAVVVEWFKEHGHKFGHIALSATSLVTGGAAAEWTFRHFGEWIQSFHLLPSPRD